VVVVVVVEGLGGGLGELPSKGWCSLAVLTTCCANSLLPKPCCHMLCFRMLC
jgi:hypothetical protein